MSFQVRAYTNADASEFLRLHNLARGLQMPLASFLEQEAEGQPWRMVTEDAGHAGKIVGVTELRRFDYIPPDWLLLTLSVDPAAQKQGIGSELLHLALAHAAVQKCAGIASNVLDDAPAQRDWALRRGFVHHAHRFASELDLSRPQPALVFPAGVSVRDMAGAIPAEWERLEALYGDLLAQTPDLEGQARWTPEQLRAHVRENPRLRPDWQLIAVNTAGDFLGICQGLPISTGIYNEFTGTVAAARGQGLARALKLELISRAWAAGVPRMRTNNHAANGPMLSVNRRLGFEQQAGSWELRLNLKGHNTERAPLSSL
jgi:GNAT superfamily N-acetyltransferase